MSVPVDVAMSVDHASDEHLNQFFGLLREELHSRVHGEVDQEGWRLKQSLMRKQTNLRRETKLFREYARQAFIDTLTLYLHGICCDIDVEPGPRQLPGRHSASCQKPRTAPSSGSSRASVIHSSPSL